MFIIVLFLAQAASITPTVSASPETHVHSQLLKGPSESEVESVYPAAAEKLALSGKTKMGCSVTVQGHLDNCTIVSEEPLGYGFGDAALKLAAKFAMTTATLNSAPIEEHVTIPLTWSMKGEAQANVRLRCLSTVSGKLTACQVQSEVPAGHSFGKAALKLAETMTMKPQLLDGRPVESTVIIPIKFQLGGDQQAVPPSVPAR
jgi:hypothetical protein